MFCHAVLQSDSVCLCVCVSLCIPKYAHALMAVTHMPLVTVFCIAFGVYSTGCVTQWAFCAVEFENHLIRWNYDSTLLRGTNHTFKSFLFFSLKCQKSSFFDCELKITKPRTSSGVAQVYLYPVPGEVAEGCCVLLTPALFIFNS